ncbi:MAG: hypothetical protein LBD95_06165 [Clostridiales Family XIII bacterium]|jgi:hypothetical protein|nr:hypothetical protein [Clostridiales Family XIII bacterium]
MTEKNAETGGQAMTNRLRAHIADTRPERHPFEGHPLAGEEDYRRNLYLRALCMALRYENEVSEEQSLFLQRLVTGAKAELTAADYMRQSLDVTVEDYGEFVAQIARDRLKYAFTVDLICACNIKPCADEQTAFVAEIIESLGVTQEELEYLSWLARCILENNTLSLSQARVWPEQIDGSLFSYYSKNLAPPLHGNVIKPVAKPATKSVAKPATKSAAKPATKSVAKPATKSAAKPATGWSFKKR